MTTKLFWTTSLMLLALNTNAQTPTQHIKIPVIVHILYSDNKTDNTINPQTIDQGNISTNLLNEKIIAELKDLNDDFLSLNQDKSLTLADYKDRIGNPDIEFTLADTALQEGQPNGIIRIKTNRNHLRQMYKASPIINPSKYLNVYIGRLNASEGSTPLPEYLAGDDDAIHLNFKWVGLHYRLLTHEAGHWLGLLHIYGGDGGSAGNSESCTTGDLVDDTPPQKESTDGGICIHWPKQPGDEYDKSCVPGKLANYNNFMDYSGQRVMFTAGQVTRMRDQILKYRPALLKN
jgi:hypothetical protein